MGIFDRLSSTSAENKVELLQEMLNFRRAVADHLNFDISTRQNKRSQATRPRIQEGDLPALPVGLLASGGRLFKTDLRTSRQKICETSKFRRCYRHLESHDKGRRGRRLVWRDQRVIRQQWAARSPAHHRRRGAGWHDPPHAQKCH
jgi:hypothetical protein